MSQSFRTYYSEGANTYTAQWPLYLLDGLNPLAYPGYLPAGSILTDISYGPTYSASYPGLPPAELISRTTLTLADVSGNVFWTSPTYYQQGHGTSGGIKQCPYIGTGLSILVPAGYVRFYANVTWVNSAGWTITPTDDGRQNGSGSFEQSILQGFFTGPI